MEMYVIIGTSEGGEQLYKLWKHKHQTIPHCLSPKQVQFSLVLKLSEPKEGTSEKSVSILAD